MIITGNYRIKGLLRVEGTSYTALSFPCTMSDFCPFIVLKILSLTLKDDATNYWGLWLVLNFYFQIEKIKEWIKHQEGGGKGNILKKLYRSGGGTLNM